MTIPMCDIFPLSSDAIVAPKVIRLITKFKQNKTSVAIRNDVIILCLS